MIEYREDMIPVAFIEMIAEGTVHSFASVALRALIDAWLRSGKEWTEENRYDA